MAMRIMPAAIQILEIGDECMQRTPCTHSCKFTLLDGRIRMLHLNGYQIHAFLNVVDSMQVTNYSLHKEHFKWQIAERGVVDSAGRCSFLSSDPSDILNDLFAEKETKKKKGCCGIQ